MNTKKKKSILLIGSVFFDIPPVVGDYQIKKVGMVKKGNRMYNIARSLSLRLHFKNKSKYFFIDEAAEEARKSDIVVLFDSTHNDILTKFASCIEEHVDLSRTKLFFYFWNTIDSLEGLKLSANWEVATYDKTDALKYSFRYVGSFYYLSSSVSSSGKIVSDICFVGTNKGRFNFICSLEKKLVKKGVETRFVFVDPIKRLFCKCFSPSIPYPEIIEYVKQSKAILDITRAGQFGLTLRFFEGIFFNKKIVTNHFGVKYYKFYHPQNIMVIDANTLPEDIKDFINSDMVSYNEEVKNLYSFETWLMRLLHPRVYFDDTNI